MFSQLTRPSFLRCHVTRSFFSSCNVASVLLPPWFTRASSPMSPQFSPPLPSGYPPPTPPLSPLVFFPRPPTGSLRPQATHVPHPPRAAPVPPAGLHPGLPRTSAPLSPSPPTPPAFRSLSRTGPPLPRSVPPVEHPRPPTPPFCTFEENRGGPGRGEPEGAHPPAPPVDIGATSGAARRGVPATPLPPPGDTGAERAGKGTREEHGGRERPWGGGGKGGQPDERGGEYRGGMGEEARVNQG